MFMNGHGKQINDYSVNIFQLNWKYRSNIKYICAFCRLSVQDRVYVKIPNPLKHLQFISYTISLMLSQNLLLLDQLKFLLSVFDSLSNCIYVLYMYMYTPTTWTQSRLKNGHLSGRWKYAHFVSINLALTCTRSLASTGVVWICFTDSLNMPSVQLTGP